MATSIRFGNNVFQKEKKILLLEQEIKDLTSALSLLKSQSSALQQSHSSSEHAACQLQQKSSLQQLEILSLSDKLAALLQEKDLWDKEKKSLKSENSELSSRNSKLQDSLNDLTQRLSSSTDLELRLRQEVRLLEQNCEKFERQLQTSKDALDEKKANIDVLEKSLAQKDKFNAILVKEKERLVKASPFEALADEKKREARKVRVMKENTRSIENKPKKVKAERENFTEEDLEALRERIKEKDLEIDKLRKENFELLVRFKNKKN